ncbi:MAG: hypothetical protein Rsou_1336 [Candidatus Ruthia sp. Asou_11_S2]|nr:hypothetical protein [Candidatus Ruthia sp. Asou_11_S2]
MYAYKVYLSNNAGESCSANFNVRLIEQSMDVSKTSGTDNTEIAIYPLLPEGDIDLRPGKPM